MTNHSTHRSLQIAFEAAVGEARLTGAFHATLGWHSDIFAKVKRKPLPPLTVLSIASISFCCLENSFTCLFFLPYMTLDKTATIFAYYLK